MKTGTIRVTGPFKGINTTLSRYLLSYTEASDCLNCVVDKGTIRRRNGFTSGISFEGYTGKVLGIYEYNKVNTATTGGLDHYQLIKVGSSLLKVQNWNVLMGVVDSGLSESELLCFQTVNNRVYYCDGTKFRVTEADTDAGTIAYNAQITPPANTATVTDAGEAAAVLNGDYDWKVTYYSSTWGQESPATDPIVTATGTPLSLTTGHSAAIDVSTLSSPTDSRIDKFRLYRRKVSAGESVWTFVKEEVVTATDIEDYTLDGSLDTTKIAPESYTTALPNFRYMCFQADVLFMAGCDDEPTRVYYTLPGQPFSVTGFVETGSGFDTDRVTGLAAFQGVVVIFKERSIWLLSGDSEDTFYLRKVVPDIGCRSHYSVVNVHDVLYFLSEDGFATFDGATAKPVSGNKIDPIRNAAVRRNNSRDKWCIGARDVLHSAIWWTWSSEGSEENDRFYLYFIDESKLTKSPCWCPWELPKTPTLIAAIRDPTSLRRWVQVGYDDGSVDYYGDSYDDSGSPINWYWKTGEITAGAPEFYKIWGEYVVMFSTAADAQTVNLKYYQNGAVTATATLTHDAQDGIYRTRLDRSSSSIMLEFGANSGDQLCEVLGYTLRATQAGRC